MLIKTKTVGVCGSDLHLFRGTHPFRHAPAILGHEIAGDVVEIGSKVTNIKVGDRVTVEPQVGCGECEMCKRGLVSLCSGKKVPGTPEWIGAFSEYFNADEKTVYKLPIRQVMRWELSQNRLRLQSIRLTMQRPEPADWSYLEPGRSAS